MWRSDQRKHMKWGLGLKSGIAAGSVYGLLAGFVSLAIVVLMREEIIKQIQAQFAKLPYEIPVTAEDVYPVTLAMSVPGSVIGGLIVGGILGIVFLLLHDQLPGRDPARKGLCFSLLMIAGTGLAEMVSPGAGLPLIMIQTSFLGFTPVNILLFLMFGYLLGRFYAKFGK